MWGIWWEFEVLVVSRLSFSSLLHALSRVRPSLARPRDSKRRKVTRPSVFLPSSTPRRFIPRHGSPRVNQCRFRKFENSIACRTTTRASAFLIRTCWRLPPQNVGNKLISLPPSRIITDTQTRLVDWYSVLFFSRSFFFFLTKIPGSKFGRSLRQAG